MDQHFASQTANAESSPTLTGRKVIVCYAYGGVQVFDATVEKAMEFFESHKAALHPAVVELASVEAGTRTVSADLIASILKDAAGAVEVGAPFPRLRRLLHGTVKRGEEDRRPEVVLTQTIADSVLLWSARAGVLVKDISAYAVTRTAAHLHLDFLGLHDDPTVQVVDGDWAFDTARDLRTIQDGRWKESATEAGKAAFILKFVKEHLTGRDYEVLEVATVR